MRSVILLACCALRFGQNTTSTPQVEKKSQADDFGLGVGAPAKQFGSLDVLSDTEGIDFGPYLKEITNEIRENWYHLIPENAEMKKGKLAIEFAIKQNGQVAGMKLVASSGDTALDRPAWEALQSRIRLSRYQSSSKSSSSRCVFGSITTPTEATPTSSVNTSVIPLKVIRPKLVPSQSRPLRSPFQHPLICGFRSVGQKR